MLVSGIQNRAVGFSARCPVCGQWVAHVWDRPVPPQEHLPLHCCTDILPQYIDEIRRGRLAMHQSVSEYRLLHAEESHTIYEDPFAWIQALTHEHALHMEEKTALPRTDNEVLNWIIEAASCENDLYAAKALYYSDRAFDLYEERREDYIREFFSLPEKMYRYALKHSVDDHRLSVMFSVYRAMYRYLVSNSDYVVYHQESDQVKAVTKVHLDPPTKYALEYLESVWPWDSPALLSPIFPPGEIADILSNNDFPLGNIGGGLDTVDEAYSDVLADARDRRLYTVNPAGVEARTQDDLFPEITLREEGDYLRGHVYDVGSNSFVPYWLNWREGFGFSWFQLSSWFTLTKDPVLLAVARVFRDLVTSDPASFKSRVVSRERANTILLPGEGRVKPVPQIVYIQDRGDDAGERAKPLRRKTPEVRMAPVLHGVAGHIRRAKRPSLQARAFAEQYGIALPDGFTFVRPHLAGKRKPDPEQPQVFPRVLP